MHFRHHQFVHRCCISALESKPGHSYLSHIPVYSGLWQFSSLLCFFFFFSCWVLSTTGLLSYRTDFPPCLTVRPGCTSRSVLIRSSADIHSQQYSTDIHNHDHLVQVTSTRFLSTIKLFCLLLYLQSVAYPHLILLSS